MKRELPKPIQDALAKQTGSNGHPSPDVLTAFAEHNLPGRESRRVTDHLARCADCREVVFLASSAVEEPASAEQEWMAGDAIARLSPALRAQTWAPQTKAGLAPASRKPSRTPVWLWAWISAVAAVLIIAGVLFLRHSESGSAPMTVASQGPSPSVSPAQPAVAPVQESEPHPAAESKARLAVPEPPAKSVHAQANQAPTADALTSAQSLPTAEEYGAAPKAAAAPATASSLVGELIGGSAKYPPAPLSTQSSFAENQDRGASNLVAKPQSLAGNPQVAMRGISAPNPQWRITPDGHLERRSLSGAWTRVLNEQPTSFHVVSVVAENNVWAGGSGGALFHSSDGGQSWSKQPLGSPNVEADTIVAIRFSDALHGVVTTEAGARWSTSDSGVSWTKE